MQASYKPSSKTARFCFAGELTVQNNCNQASERKPKPSATFCLSSTEGAISPIPKHTAVFSELIHSVTIANEYNKPRNNGTNLKFITRFSLSPFLFLTVLWNVILLLRWTHAAPEVAIVDEEGVPLYDKYYEVGSTIKLMCKIRHISMLRSVVYWIHNENTLNHDTTRGGIR